MNLTSELRYFSTNDPGRVNYTQPHLPTLQYFSNCIKFVREVEAGIQVNTNEVVYQSFGKHGSQIGSNAFNGDLGIFVASEQGVLFGRFSNDEAGNTTAAKTLLEAFSKNAIALENPQDSQIFVFAEAEYANPSALANSPVAQPFIDYVRNVLPASLPLFTVTYVLPQPGWFLQNGIIVTFNDSRDDFVDETELDKAIRGLVLVQNPGGGKAQSLVTFVNSYAPTFANPNLDNVRSLTLDSG